VSLECGECGCVFDKHPKVSKCPNCHGIDYRRYVDGESYFSWKKYHKRFDKKMIPVSRE